MLSFTYEDLLQEDLVFERAFLTRNGVSTTGTVQKDREIRLLTVAE